MAVGSLSAAAIQLLVTNVRSLPQLITSPLEHLVIDVDEDGASVGLSAIFKALRICRQKMFLLPLARLLISKLGDDRRNSLVGQLIDEKLGPTAHSPVGLVGIFIETGRATAEHILEIAVERAGRNLRQTALRAVREWIEAITNR
jgi:hypothetical protein